MSLLIHGIDTPDYHFAPAVVRGHLIRFEVYPPATQHDRERQGGELLTAQRIRRLREAIAHIDARIRHYLPANEAFTRIPGGVGLSLDALLSRFSIVICLDRAHPGPLSGATPEAPTIAGRTRMSLTRGLFGRSGRAVEATILHELAHVAGASPSITSRDAEDVLRHCRMGDQFHAANLG